MIGLILTLALVGLVLWLIETYVPMAAPFRTIIRVVVVVCVVLWLLSITGILDRFDVPVPRLR